MLILLSLWSLALFCFLTGYLVGKEKGKKDGQLKAQLYAPLQLRQAALEKGYCQLCDSRDNF